MLIYIASPYNGTPQEIEYRMNSVSKEIGRLQKEGHYVITPLLYHYIMGHTVNPNDEYWINFSKAMLNFGGIDKMIVIMLKGWEKSYGVKIEIETCNRLGIPIEYKEIQSEKGEQIK